MGRSVCVTPYFRYLLGHSSNMAIVDVEIPSGYMYTGWRYANDFVRMIPKINTCMMLFNNNVP